MGATKINQNIVSREIISISFLYKKAIFWYWQFSAFHIMIDFFKFSK